MIRNVTRQDQGTYICRGENGEGRRSVAAVSFVEVLREYPAPTRGSRVRVPVGSEVKNANRKKELKMGGGNRIKEQTTSH